MQFRLCARVYLCPVHTLPSIGVASFALLHFFYAARSLSAGVPLPRTPYLGCLSRVQLNVMLYALLVFGNMLSSLSALLPSSVCFHMDRQSFSISFSVFFLCFASSVSLSMSLSPSLFRHYPIPSYP